MTSIHHSPIITKGQNLSPYNQIQKVPLVAADLESRSRGYSVRIEDPSDSTGWKECGIVSQDYCLVPNADVRDLALSIADRAGGDWQIDKEHFDGKRFTLSLLSKTSAVREVKLNDPVGFGLHFVNSYDGSARLSAQMVVWRLVCTNGMLAPKMFKSVRFKHDNSARGWREETESALSMIRYADVGLERFVQAAQNLASMRITSSQLRTIRSEVLDRLPVTLWGHTLDRYLADEELSGWGLLNALTDRTWHAKKQKATDFAWNEYGTTGLIEHALGTSLN
jgi:hypothetical protein